MTVAVAKKLIAAGKIPANDSAVLCITGNGLKTLDAVSKHAGRTAMKRNNRDFSLLIGVLSRFREDSKGGRL